MEIIKSKYEIYKELYYHEIDLKEKINNRLNFSFGLNSIFIGGISYCYKKYLEYINISINIFSAIFFTILIIAFIISTYFVIRAFFGFSYDYVAPANDIEQGFNKYVEFYKQHEKIYIEAGMLVENEIENSFIKNLTDNYISATTKNRCQNVKKSQYLRKYSISVLFIFLFFILNISLISIYDYKEKIIEEKTPSRYEKEVIRFMSKKDNENQNENQETPKPELPKPPQFITTQTINEHFTLDVERKTPVKSGD